MITAEEGESLASTVAVPAVEALRQNTDQRREMLDSLTAKAMATTLSHDRDVKFPSTTTEVVA